MFTESYVATCVALFSNTSCVSYCILMSDKERPRVDDGGGGGGVGGSGGDDEGGVMPTERDCPKENKCKGCGRKGERVSLFRFRKGKKLLHPRRKDEGIYVNLGCWWRRGSVSACCLCLKQPRTLDSSGESPTSDPNSSEFTFDMLRTLIEKNDFYSKESNPHLVGDD